MIDIRIQNKSLHIADKTAICLERTNAIFDIDNITADIVWTFDIQARENMPIIDNCEHIFFSNIKKYNCFVFFNRFPIGSGSLYLQDVSDNNIIQCGLTINEFSAEWKNRMLQENNMGSIEIDGANFKEEFKSFIKDSLNEDSNIKFFPFIDEQFSDSEDFGFFRNQRSSLSNDRTDFIAYVNRVFTDDEGNIIECYDNAPQGLRIFNSDSGIGQKINGYHFAPALRLSHVVKKIFELDGYTVTGNFCNNEYINNLFIQSLNAIDGDILQHGYNLFVALGGVTGSETSSPQKRAVNFIANDEYYNQFTVKTDSSISISYKLLLPNVDELKMNQEGWRQLNRYDEAYFLLIKNPNVSIENSFCRISTDERTSHIGIFEKFGEIDGGGYIKYLYYTAKRNDVLLLQLTNTAYYQAMGCINGNTAETKRNINLDNIFDIDTSTSYQIQLIKAKVATSDYNLTIISDDERINGIATSERGRIEHIQDIEIIESNVVNLDRSLLNVFANKIELNEHLPKLTNGDFVKAICKFFGLNIYVCSNSRTVQINFFADEENTKSLDVSKYVVGHKKLVYDPKRFEISFGSTMEAKNINSFIILDEVTTKEELPPPRRNINKYCFVANENKYYHSSIDEDSKKTKWIHAVGNNKTLAVGTSDNIEEVNIDVKIPNMRVVDENHIAKYFCEVGIPGCSKLLQEEYSGEFDLVLMQYVGKKLIRLENEGNHQFATIERANPTFYGENGATNRNYINLTTTGEQSVGEMWLHPKYDFIGNGEYFEFTLAVPTVVLLEILTLLSPQNGPITQQTRWLMVKNQRYLPKKIIAELSSSDIAKVTIECVRKHITA